MDLCKSVYITKVCKETGDSAGKSQKIEARICHRENIYIYNRRERRFWGQSNKGTGCLTPFKHKLMTHCLLSSFDLLSPYIVIQDARWSSFSIHSRPRTELIQGCKGSKAVGHVYVTSTVNSASKVTVWATRTRRHEASDVRQSALT